MTSCCTFTAGLSSIRVSLCCQALSHLSMKNFPAPVGMAVILSLRFDPIPLDTWTTSPLTTAWMALVGDVHLTVHVWLIIFYIIPVPPNRWFLVVFQGYQTPPVGGSR